MATTKWSDQESLTSYYTTELNSLADDTTEDSGAVIDNSANKYTHMDLKVDLATVDLSSNTNPAIHIYALHSADGGTDYDDGGDAKATAATYPAGAPIAIIPLQVGTGTQVHVGHATGVRIPPSKFKLVLLNKSGSALATTNQCN
jgi:hypothetical protein